MTALYFSLSAYIHLNDMILVLYNFIFFSFCSGGDDYVEFEEIIMTISVAFGNDAAQRKRMAPMATQECFNVTIIADERVEFDEMFQLHLSTLDADIALFPNYTTIVISNDDCKSV